MFNFFTAQTLSIFKAEKKEAGVAYCVLSSIKRHHHAADTAYPPR